MKRENNGSDDGGPNKKIRKNDEVVRLLIPSKIAGAIIGKGGQNIQKLRSQYKATVSVDDCQGPERTVLISSDLDSICNIVAEMLKNFEEKEGEIDLRVLIHQSLAGCVIGKAGSKIKELRDKIGSRIKIFSNVAPQSTDRVVQILGKPEHCVESIKEIVNLVKPTPIRGVVHNYDPLNFDDVYADEYGGFGQGTGGGRMGGNGFRNGGRFGSGDRGNSDRYNERGGRDGGRRSGGDLDRGRSMNRDRDFVDPWARPPMGNGGGPMSQPPQGMGGGFNLGNGNMGGGNNFGMMSGGGSGSDLDGKNTTQVTIPKDLAGAIIGKGGGRIRRIRSESNAFITIDEPLPGSNDRIITITGTPKQIQTAQYLLQQSVHENRRKF